MHLLKKKLAYSEFYIVTVHGSNLYSSRVPVVRILLFNFMGRRDREKLLSQLLVGVALCFINNL